MGGVQWQFSSLLCTIYVSQENARIHPKKFPSYMDDSIDLVRDIAMAIQLVQELWVKGRK